MQHVTSIGEARNAFTSLIGNCEGKNYSGDRSLFGRIKINLKAIGCNGMEWTYLAEDTDEWRILVNAYELPSPLKFVSRLASKSL
jgi:hypothetical protein